MNVKTFIIKAIVFVILFIVADQLCGMGFKLLNKTAGDKFAREEFMRHEMTAEVVLLGSSRCTHHYMPNILQDSLGMTVYNCGQRGNGIIYEYGRLQTIYARYTPKIVIVDFIQGYDLEVNDNNRYLDFLKADYGTNNAVDSIFRVCDPLSPVKMCLQSYRYNSTLCDLLLNTVLRNRGRFSKDGFMALQGEIETVEPKRTKVMPLEVDPIKVEYIRKMASERKQGCRMIFVLSPCYSYPHPEFVSTIERIAKENGVEFMNYSEDMRFLGNGKLYSDGAHLNVKGAEMFSKILAGDLKK